MQIKIASVEIAQDELQRLLVHRFGSNNAESISIHGQSVRLRGGDATVLVALVSASSAAIGALLTGVLQIAKERCAGKISLQGNDGSRLEVPANIPPEKLDSLIETLRKLSEPRIHIGLQDR